MVCGPMAIRVSPSRTVGLLAAVTGAAIACGGCEMASLPDQGGIHPASLAFSVQPEYATAGFPLEPGVSVTVIESNGDTAYESTASIGLSIASGTGTPGAHLGGVTQVAAVNGTANFPQVTIDSAGTGYRLLAVATALGGAASDTFDVTAGVPTRLAFLRQPSGAPAGDTISPAVQVAVQDVLGNIVLVASDSIALAIAANPGAASLGGTAVRRADAGVATFPGLSISAAGVGYTLAATARGFAADTSAPFTITAVIPPQPGVQPRH